MSGSCGLLFELFTLPRMLRRIRLSPCTALIRLTLLVLRSFLWIVCFLARSLRLKLNFELRIELVDRFEWLRSRVDRVRLVDDRLAVKLAPLIGASDLFDGSGGGG